MGPLRRTGNWGLRLCARAAFGGRYTDLCYGYMAFWRRVLHTCHHRTQVQAWLRMANAPLVPAIYGPSGDVSWAEDDPTYTPEAAARGAGPAAH